MNEFDGIIKNGIATKSCFPGVSRLNGYAKAIINEEHPDAVLLCVGTNNLSK